MFQTTSARRSTTVTGRFATWLGSLPLETKALLALCLVAVALRLWPIAGASRDFDEGVYWQSLRSLAAGHPMFRSTFSSQPPLFLISLYPLYLLFGQTLEAARLAIAVYSLAGLIAIFFAGRAIAGRWAGLIACALLAADPLYLTESHTLQAEVPALVFEIVCVALAAAAMRRVGRARHLLAAASGIALGLGIMIKLFDVVAVVPAALLLAQPAFAPLLAADGHLQRPPRERLRRELRTVVIDLGLLTAGAALACGLVLLPFLSSWSALYDQVITFHLVAESTSNLGLVHNLSLIAHAGGEYPVGIVALVASVLAIRRRDWRIVPPLAWLLASATLLVRQQPAFDHHVVLLAPALALVAGLILPRAPRDMPRSGEADRDVRQHQIATRRIPLLIAAALLVSLGVGVYNTQIAAQPVPEPQAQMAAALRAATLPGDPVVTDDPYVAGLANRSVLPQLVDTSEVRIRSGYLTAAQLEAIITHTDTRVILFASGRFELIPGFRTWVDDNFTQVATFGDGRALYIKKPAGPVLV